MVRIPSKSALGSFIFQVAQSHFSTKSISCPPTITNSHAFHSIFSRTCTSLSNGCVNRSHFSYPALGATASLSLLPLQIIIIALVSQTITRSRRCCEACILRYRRFTPSSGPKCETREELNIVCECLALGMLPRRSCIACNRANQHCARPSGIRCERCEEQDIECQYQRTRIRIPAVELFVPPSFAPNASLPHYTSVFSEDES